ncbi:NADPH-dependent F420 reductase [Nguyenibacter vanlangensis]|uniref:NADPH-dependent F420 reductase n=2 Tax=Nguyenibacter vanlangensis TaxID=1216886 RepID=A0ABZ3D793_9PROT
MTRRFFPMHRRSLLAALPALLLPSVPRAAAPLRIGAIGAGHVGSTLGGLWLKAGHPVMFSARDLSSAQAVASDLGPLARAGTPEQAAGFGDVVLLAVPYGALPALGPALRGILQGKVVIDACNPYPWRDGDIARTAQQQGAGAVTQSLFPGAHVVRAFNSEDMSTIDAEAHRLPPRLGIPYAGDDAQAKQVVRGLIVDAGFDPVDAGPLSAARAFQPGGPGFEADLNATQLRGRLGL